MDAPVAVGIGGLVVFLLAGLARWQRRIDEEQSLETLADLEEARDVGSDKPLAQFPTIDEQACIGCATCVAACPEEGVLGMVDGIAKVVHGARCIGHGHCAEACPIGAIHVGLGDTSDRSDIPILDEQLQTSTQGVFIAGELGGLALIRIANDQGVQAMDAIVRDLIRTKAVPAPGEESPDDAQTLDVLIVGAGPAGLAASLRAKELGLRFLTIDQDDIGGTVGKYPRRKLTMTGAMTMPLHGRVKKKDFRKEELIEFWRELIQQHELPIKTGVQFRGMTGEAGAFHVQTSHGIVPARRILLALGRRGTPRKLGVPGEELHKVQYQLVDAATYTGERILVVGGGDSAIEAATALANQPGNSVVLSYRRHAFFRLKARNQQRIAEYQQSGRIRVLFESKPTQIDAESVLLEVKRDDATVSVRAANDFVFVFAGGDPPYPLLQSLGVRFGGQDVFDDATLHTLQS